MLIKVIKDEAHHLHSYILNISANLKVNFFYLYDPLCWSTTDKGQPLFKLQLSMSDKILNK